MEDADKHVYSKIIVNEPPNTGDTTHERGIPMYCKHCNRPLTPQKNVQDQILCTDCQSSLSQAMADDMSNGGNWTGMTGIQNVPNAVGARNATIDSNTAVDDIENM
jgi:hypothetical protein